MAAPKAAERESMGSILVGLGVISAEQLDAALPHCDRHQRNLLSVLADMGVSSEERLLKAISVQQRVPYFTSFSKILDPEAAKLIPQKLARKYLVLPLCKVRRGLVVGMVNPVDIVAIDTVSARTGLQILPVLTTRKNLFESINSSYETTIAPAAGATSVAADTAMVAGGVKIVPRTAEASLSRYAAEDNSVIEIVDGIIAEAIQAKTSDIHLEPTSSNLRMRLRIDGMLRERRSFPKDLEPALVARVKILALLDITEVRLPQDGHISVDYGGSAIDLRVSTLPTIHGEKVVIRVLDQAASRKTLSDLGLPDEVRSTFYKIVRAPMGLLLVTGPTGSGKTTTLYAALNEINTLEKNIVTLEDPVEYRLGGINQVETNHRIGFDFSTGLRSILRQDPNVVLVGEIRDHETAEIAIQAAITGHLVYSTLHTKDTVSTIARLVNMKLEPFLLASALSGVLAQRLVRVLCAKCKKPSMPTAQEAALLGTPLRLPGPFYTSAGCDACLNLGYIGRRGIYEWLVINREMRSLIMARASADELRETARKSGMRTLQEAGLELVYNGITSLTEIIRVTHEEDLSQAEPEAA